MLGRFLKKLWESVGANRGPSVPAPLQRALERHAAGAGAEAEALCREALRVRPQDAASAHFLGYLLLLRGETDSAIEYLQRALALRPDLAECHFHLATALRARGEAVGAFDHLHKAAALKPGIAAVHDQCAALYSEQDRPEEALAEHRLALAADPKIAVLYLNLARTLRALGRLDEALAHLERAVSLDPGDPDIHFNRGLALLEAGDLARGWPEYEWRFKQRHGAPVHRDFPFPPWQGEPLAGRRLLIWGEQGVGDELQFASALQELIDAGGECVYECSPKLVPLLARSFPGATIVARSDPPHAAIHGAFDFQVAAGGIARWLRPTPDSFPRRAAWLAADPERVAYWRRRVEALGPGLKAGFSWSGINRTGERAFEYTRLDEWGALFAVPGLQWVCLQYGPCADELRAVRDRFGRALHQLDGVDYMNDLDEVGALMSALDIVISAPTTVSVQAAALGVETWQMFYGPYWQKHGTTGNPWFPQLSLFERRPGEGWPEVLERVAKRLRERSAGALDAASAGEPAAARDAI